VGGAVQDALEGDGDLLLDFFGGEAGIGRDDDNGGIGDVGVGVDLQVTERPDPEGGEGDRDQQDEDATPEREVDQRGQG
jgi:hypothetical protein